MHSLRRLRGSISTIALLAIAASAAPALAHRPLDEQELAVDEQLELDPHDTASLLTRAALFEKRADWDSAIATTLSAAQHGADENLVEVGLANLFLKAELPKTAEAFADRVLAREPERASALLVRARVHRALELPEAAADDYFAALSAAASPQPGIVLEAIGALESVGRSQDALVIADRAMAKIGTVVTIALPAVSIEREAGRPDAALARIDRLLLQSPKQPFWLAERAEILDQAGREDEARTAREQILEVLAARPGGRMSSDLTALQQRLRKTLASSPNTVDN